MRFRKILRNRLKVIVILIFLIVFLAFSLKNRNYKIIVIGVDAGEWAVIYPLVENGSLPNIEELIQKGSYGYLASPYASSPISWTEIATGKTKEKHGVNWFFTENNTRFFDATDIKSKRVWEILSEKNKSVGVYNFYFTYPIREVNGFIVSDRWLYLNESNLIQYSENLAQKYIYPKEIFSEFKNKNLLDNTIEKDFDRMLYLLNKYRPDFFIGATYHIDELEHFLWKYWKPDEFNFTNSSEINKYRSILIDAYQKLDNFLGNLRNLINEQSVIFIVSDHGMTSERPINYHISLNPLFKELNLLNFSYETLSALPGSKIIQPGFVSYFRDDLYTTEFSLLEEKDKDEVLKVLSQIEYEDGFKFFSEINFSENKIKVCINSTILRFHLKKEEQHLEQYVILSLPNKKNFRLEVTEKSGDHSKNGVIIVKGPMIKKNYLIKNASVYDITPTILYLSNIPIPKDMDGKVLTEMIDEIYLILHPIKYTEESSQKQINETFLNRTVEKEMIERLRELGYIV
jgi:predicted AlkP superfamily phosphohydrolase/phosphomutase